MYTLIRHVGARALALEQVPAMFASLVIAETFYKFHSFTLECVAFLGTWYLFDAAGTLFRRLLGRAVHERDRRTERVPRAQATSRKNEEVL